MNKPVPRSLLRDLCEQLGYDYHEVESITLTGSTVTVTLPHLVYDDERESDDNDDGA